MQIEKEKLARFEQTILTQTDLKIKEIYQELEQIKQAELEKARQEEYDKMYVLMQKKVHDVQWKYKQLVTKQKLDARRELLLFRTELSKKVFKQAEEKLALFSDSKDYKPYLLKKLNACNEQNPFENSVIYIREADMKYADDIKKVFPKCKIMPDNSIKLGGFKVLFEDKNVLIDETFESSLADQHKHFYETSGLSAAI